MKTKKFSFLNFGVVILILHSYINVNFSQKQILHQANSSLWGDLAHFSLVINVDRICRRNGPDRNRRIGYPLKFGYCSFFFYKCFSGRMLCGRNRSVHCKSSFLESKLAEENYKKVIVIYRCIDNPSLYSLYDCSKSHFKRTYL